MDRDAVHPASAGDAPTLNGLEVHEFADVDDWESWLAAHHDSAAGVWLRIAKKGSPTRSVTAADAGDVALCYGWIDSHRKANDGATFLQKYSPRRPKGTWSKVNVERVERLIATGRMRPPGLEEIAKAKADGRWDAAYESQRNATVPADLAAALTASAGATARFDALGRTERYALILRVLKSRGAADRAVRVAKVIAELEDSGPAR
ncbi:MAG: YdeI/OmpD-associated family protein [Chloroflexota bacterium]